jgi:hypothetical protein
MPLLGLGWFVLPRSNGGADLRDRSLDKPGLRDCLNSPHEPRFEQKLLYGRRNAMSVSGNTVERFDAPEGDFCRNPESKIVADLWDRQRESCSKSNIWRPINRSPRREANGSDARGRCHGDYSNSL